LTYKKFDSLYKTAASVKAQDYPNIEYIICDDGSENFKEEYIQSILIDLGIENVIILSHEKNVGIVSNFNDGIKASRGQYIVPLSADDEFYDSSSVKNYVTCFIKNDADIVTGKRNCVNECGDTILVKPLPYQCDILINGSREDVINELFKFSFVSGACTAYSKRILDKYKGFNENYYLIEDFPFYAKFMMDGGKIYFLDEIMINYGMGGITNRNTKTSALLTMDREKYLREIIKPNIRYTRYLIKREILYRFHEMYHRDQGVLYKMGFILYLDFILLLGIRKIKRIIGRKICR